MAVVPKQNGLDILRRLVPLNTLSDEMLSELMDSATFEKISKGRYLFREGDADSKRVYLLSGSLSLVEDGKEVDSVVANSNMARYPVAQHVPRRYSVRAKSKAEVVRIDGGLLSDLLVRGGSSIYQVQELATEADNDWMGQLLQSPIFQRIPAANIQNIMMRMEEVQVSNGEVIIHQGDEGDYFYLLNQGQCAVTRESESGELQEIARLRAGECFGEESLLSGRPRSSTVCMLTDGVLFRLPKSDFVEYIKLPLANAISYHDAQRRVEKGAAWLDVRSPHEHARVAIPDSRNIPFNDLRQQAPKLETDVSYVVYCQDGLVSSAAVYLLMELGVDAYVLERGLESVPDDDLDRDEKPDGAQVINFRQEQETAQDAVPESGSVPDDEAALLRERLQKTEAQAQEQMQRARKMKLMLEKLKGRLAETEQASQHEQEEKQRLGEKLEQLRGQLKEQAASSGSLEAQQAQMAQQLEEVTGERDRLQAELDDVCRQVGQLEKRLEDREQDDSREIKSLDRERAELQSALEQAEQALQQSRSEQAVLKEEEQRLQASLQQASEENESLKSELEVRDTAASEAARSAQQEASEREASLNAALEQAQARVTSLETALAEQGSSEQQQSEQLAAAAEALESAQQEASEREASLSAALEQAQAQVVSLETAQEEWENREQQQSEQLVAAEKQQQLLNAERDQLQSELERAGGQIARLESERREAEQADKRQRVELEGALKAAQESQQAAEAERLTAANERDRVNAELAVLQGHYRELKQTLQERDNSLAELRQGSGEQAQEEVGRLEQALEQVRAELRDAQTATEADRRELESLREQVQSARAEAEGQQAMKQELVSLQAQREQLDETRASLEEALRDAQEKLSGLEAERQQQKEGQARLEQALEQQQAEAEQLKSAAASAPVGGDFKVLQAELATLNEALDEADSSYEELSRERDDLKSALEQLRQERAGSEPEQGEEVQRLKAELGELGRELAAVREQAEAELQQLRDQLEVQRAEENPATDGDELKALQQELQEARGQLKELELSSSTDAAEGEVLRQEIDKLRRSLEERTTELEQTRKESLLLEEKTEERNSEIDRLKLAVEAAQVDADEAQFKKQEALEARKQVEEALYQLQKQVESERPRDDLLQNSLTSSSESPVLTGGGRRPLAALLLGAVLAFGLAEGVAIMGGKGELFSGLWTDNVRPARVETATTPEQPDATGPVNGEQIIDSSVPSDSLEDGAISVTRGGDESTVAPVKSQVAVAPEVTASRQQESVAKPEPVPVIPSAPEPAVAERPKPATPQPAVQPPKQARSSGPATGTPLRDSLASGGRGPEMVYIRGGEFEMGSSVHFLSREEQPVHPVQVPSFSIGRYEVTFREYGLFAAATGRRLPDDLGWGQGNRPVINVSWEDATAYAEWLSAETGRRYRLPSEAEWEYAAAAGTDTPFWWGFELGNDRANCFNCGSQWDGVSTAPVGRFEANPFGVHNTAGNVMEWVSDCYHNSYTGAPSDGSSWQEVECSERVARGGAFNKPGDSLRVTKRNRHGADTRLFVLGFRIVREVN